MSTHAFNSEVARMLTEIEVEYLAGRQALYGLSAGRSRHDFIERSVTRMGELHAQLHELVGDEATDLVAHALDSLEPESCGP